MNPIKKLYKNRECVADLTNKNAKKIQWKEKEPQKRALTILASFSMTFVTLLALSLCIQTELLKNRYGKDSEKKKRKGHREWWRHIGVCFFLLSKFCLMGQEGFVLDASFLSCMAVPWDL